MSNAQATKSRKRIQTTQICSGWTGAASVSMDCSDNAGLAQHDLKVVPSQTIADDAGCVLAWIRPIDCKYFVRLGYLRLSVGELVFRGLFDAVRLDVATPWPSNVTVAASISSIGTTYNSSSSEGDETHWRRRYLRTNVAGNWNGTEVVTKHIIDHSPLSQHMISVGGGVGTVQAAGSLNNAPYVPLGSLDAGGGFVVFSGYYDRIMLTPNVSSGPVHADVHSIAQELMIDESGAKPVSPMSTLDGDVDMIPAGHQMLWSTAGELVGNGSLDISGALIEVA